MISQKSIFVQAIYFTVKELVRVGWSMYYDGIMRRNVLYFIGSSMSNSDKYQIVNALLLLDIVTKVQNLGNILYIIQIQWQNLISTFSFLVIVVYIFAFLAFESFSAEYQAADGPNDPNAPPYNMYCETLLDCLVTTLNYGMRAGGGIGDTIEQPLITAEDYTHRYFFDFLFFLSIFLSILRSRLCRSSFCLLIIFSISLSCSSVFCASSPLQIFWYRWLSVPPFGFLRACSGSDGSA